jgi:type II secretory pathway component PulM
MIAPAHIFVQQRRRSQSKGMTMHIALSQAGRRRLTIAAGAAMLLGVGFSAGCVVAAQPHMYNALHELQNAQAQLQEAISDKGGHRVTAIRLVNEAIGEVQAGIAAGR